MIIKSLQNIKGGGDVAAKLLANDMNVNCLRTNGTLRKDEWVIVDRAVVAVAKKRMVGVNDLVSRGLVYRIPNGLGTTILETENISDMSAADMTMDGSTPGTEDRVNYELVGLPLPLTHKSFRTSIRSLTASRKQGQPLDVTQAAVASMKVAERIEETLFTGGDNLKFGGSTIYGYQDFPQRTEVSLSSNWDASGVTGANIRDDVLAMKQASIDDKHYGPWIVYIPTSYETVLDEDYSTAKGQNTIRERILQIAGISEIKVADYLTADNVVMVELAQETVRMVIGLDPTVVEWESQGGMIMHHKVMAIIVPQLRADQNGTSGIVHLS